MGVRVYLNEDIRAVIEAAQIASDGPIGLLRQVLASAGLQVVPVEKVMDIYRQGFYTALETVARGLNTEVSLYTHTGLPCADAPEHKQLSVVTHTIAEQCAEPTVQDVELAAARALS